jgi:hypothetical protein
VIGQLAAVRVRAACVAAKVHPDTEVQSFHMGSRNETRLGMSASDTWERARYPARGRKPIRPGNIGHAVELYELREMDAGSKVRVYAST